MSFLINLNMGLSDILARGGKDTELDFAVHINDWKRGDRKLPEYFGVCKVTRKFLRDFRSLCEKHKCGEK